MARSPFTERVIAVIRSIPEGSVATYGQVAALAENHRAARQVVRILHTLSEKENLPWHRVVNRLGEISLKEDAGYEVQRELLESEEILFDSKGSIDLKRFLWDAAE